MSFRSTRHRRPKTSRRLTFENTEARCLMAADGFELLPDAFIESAVASEISVVATTNDSSASADGPSPVLMVISNQDFWYQDYADTRASLEAAGLEVVVAATTTEVARPHARSGQGSDGGFVVPDLALSDANANDFSAIVFSGGWGMAQYQYGFEGTYHNSAYNGTRDLKVVVNDLVNAFVEQDKHVAAVCYGVSVLAFADVDGESLLQDRTVTAWNGAAPGADGVGESSRGQIERQGATMLPANSIGDTSTSTDDVFIDGKIITAQNYNSASYFGTVVAREVIDDFTSRPNDDDGGTEDETEPKPVLMVIANQDFYHREYYESRESIEAAGLEVVVAAATTETATPHAISVVEGREPNVEPDLALSDVNAEDYSTIVFIGGYGAASYQYGFEGTYDNGNYQGDETTKQIVNDVINDFVAQDKHVAAICNGVTVLAWARVDGVSPIDGHTVSSWAGTLPSADGGEVQATRDHIESNGATQVASGSIGDANTVADDVIVDGNIITAENYDSAYAFGAIVAQEVIAKFDAESNNEATDQAILELVG
ncbi:DJ-1/PfpI family protein [Stieleria sp. JC731]|uniref:DJ-1/PfpI family protein n=1 Tax=Pirellulaceae TaxID=2691357 RepID=UPI001E5D7969|nr:DJ-1/PfpI family protein [Stieleria sp. JC731]MCC9602514.1 DJ-1/PfpI family protein [Stieleria sp. JC731]